MYPLNIRKEAENGLFSAFQFWKLPKTKTRLDGLLDDFLFQFKDVSINPETIFDATNFGIVNMMKAIMNLQRTILNCPEGIFNRDEFVDNSLMKLRSLNKEERNDIFMMELKKILWECFNPSEFINSLFQEELNLESFVIEKQQYRRRKTC